VIREFPDDENGAVLKGMHDGGDDLSRPRQIDFTVVFPGELQAQEFAGVFRRRSFEVSLKRSDVVPELPWDVTISSVMVPDHQAITDNGKHAAGHCQPSWRKKRRVGMFRANNP
jgi:hypothetical protein